MCCSSSYKTSPAEGQRSEVSQRRPMPACRGSLEGSSPALCLPGAPAPPSLTAEEADRHLFVSRKTFSGFSTCEQTGVQSQHGCFQSKHTPTIHIRSKQGETPAERPGSEGHSRNSGGPSFSYGLAAGQGGRVWERGRPHHEGLTLKPADPVGSTEKRKHKTRLNVVFWTKIMSFFTHGATFLMMMMMMMTAGSSAGKQTCFGSCHCQSLLSAIW